MLKTRSSVLLFIVCLLLVFLSFHLYLNNDEINIELERSKLRVEFWEKESAELQKQISELRFIRDSLSANIKEVETIKEVVRYEYIKKVDSVVSLPLSGAIEFLSIGLSKIDID